MEIVGQLEAFEPHPMMDPDTGETLMANTYAEHLSLAEQGWIHS